MSSKSYLAEFISIQKEVSGTIDLFGKKSSKAAQSFQRWGSEEKDDIKSLTDNLYGIFVKIEGAFEHHYKHGIERSVNSFYEIIDEVEYINKLSKKKDKTGKKLNKISNMGNKGLYKANDKLRNEYDEKTQSIEAKKRKILKKALITQFDALKDTINRLNICCVYGKAIINNLPEEYDDEKCNKYVKKNEKFMKKVYEDLSNCGDKSQVKWVVVQMLVVTTTMIIMKEIIHKVPL
ncbi:hypothetical protein BCR36DRAFT_32915 [Piromyces finnis]|uniref:BAR domain-containing protein n=1 Tax=Piromyces finnis TaxID=1754191 RepID=A0A1Y1UG99_9FUNG|nr:hypothetical protein BCR36DRAFT_32915 [Piromyces finnis]|eukprot:ORX36536.1 hypothetical protein BCR36DRAFT_32915 [Piromyces finnis]